jgi:signal transduction histidine kinase
VAKLHEPLHETRRAKPVGAELGEEALADRQADVETDEIRQRQRSHRVAVAKLHGLIDVGRRRYALLEHAHRLVAQTDAQAARGKTRDVVDDDRRLAEPRSDRAGLLEGGWRRQRPAHDLQELHDVHGIEKMKPHDALGAIGRRRQLGDRQRRGVARQERVGRQQTTGLGEELLFPLHPLGDSLNKELRRRQRRHRRRRLQPRQSGLLIGLLQLALLDADGERLFDLFAPRIEDDGVEIDQGGLVPGHTQDLGDAVTHGACADDDGGSGNGGELHAILLRCVATMTTHCIAHGVPLGKTRRYFSFMNEAIAVRLEHPEDEEERRLGLRWLALLRWWAASGAMLGVFLSIALSWTFVSTPAIVAGLVAMVIVNAVLLVRTRAAVGVDRNELLLHAALDMFMLTWLLAWSGGVENPLSMAYAFHVVLGALLNGRRGVLFALSGSVLCMGTLWGLQLAQLLPVPPIKESPPLLWALSLGLLVTGLGYLAHVTAERAAAERDRVRQKQEDSAQALGLLLEMLTALKVGVEVRDEHGHTILENAGNVASLPSASSAIERAQHRLDGDSSDDDLSEPRRVTERLSLGHIEGAHDDAGAERIVELIALRPSHPRVRHAFLTVDRTDLLLVEQRHLMLERFATIGRAMQGVAHELNTPLTTMLTLARDVQAALQQATLPAALRTDVEESLALIVEETRRCRSLTQSLLSTANESGRRRGQTASLADVARRAARMVGARLDAVVLDDSLERIKNVDADRVVQILMNLIQNALAATQHLEPLGGPRVWVRADVEAEQVRIWVDDCGTGLPAEVRARLFEPFVTTKTEGTGLGLYTSQQLARELGGSLTLNDAPSGSGTRATLTVSVSSSGVLSSPANG